MRPLQFKDIKKQELTDALHLLDISHFGEHFLSALIARSCSNVRSKSGDRTFPLEIWTMIIDELKADPPRDHYCYVRASPMPLPPANAATDLASPTTTAPAAVNAPGDENKKEDNTPRLIRCEQYVFSPAEWQAGEIGSAYHRDAFDEWLQNPDTADPKAGAEFEEDGYEQNFSLARMPELKKLSEIAEDGDQHGDKEGNVFYISIAPGEAGKLIIPCLMVDVESIDVISFMEDGRCFFCGGNRWICPGCTGGKSERFDVFMGCGVSLACPLCMGQDVADEHRYFLQARYYSDVEDDDDAVEAMESTLQRRAKELDYDW